MMDELRTFAEWLKEKAVDVKAMTADKVVEEFRREKAIREGKQDDATDANR